VIIAKEGCIVLSKGNPSPSNLIIIPPLSLDQKSVILLLKIAQFNAKKEAVLH
jgi:hypothetical protein